jgi:hypothetical protein
MISGAVILLWLLAAFGLGRHLESGRRNASATERQQLVYERAGRNREGSELPGPFPSQRFSRPISPQKG